MQRFRMIIVPAIVPSIISAWSVNLGNGIRVAMVAELVGATSGVGFQLLKSQSIYDMSGAIAWTLLLVVYLLLLQGGLALVEKRLLQWRVGEERDV
jgi:ABC-type nitrate/sulfonate/bicarbonate transport system permease component